MLKPSLHVPGAEGTAMEHVLEHSCSWSIPAGCRGSAVGQHKPHHCKVPKSHLRQGQIRVLSFLSHPLLCSAESQSPDRLLLPPPSGTQGFTTKQHLLQCRFTQPEPLFTLQFCHCSCTNTNHIAFPRHSCQQGCTGFPPGIEEWSAAILVARY